MRSAKFCVLCRLNIIKLGLILNHNKGWNDQVLCTLNIFYIISAEKHIISAFIFSLSPLRGYRNANSEPKIYNLQYMYNLRYVIVVLSYGNELLNFNNDYSLFNNDYLLSNNRIVHNNHSLIVFDGVIIDFTSWIMCNNYFPIVLTDYRFSNQIIHNDHYSALLLGVQKSSEL